MPQLNQSEITKIWLEETTFSKKIAIEIWGYCRVVLEIHAYFMTVISFWHYESLKIQSRYEASIVILQKCSDWYQNPLIFHVAYKTVVFDVYPKRLWPLEFPTCWFTPLLIDNHEERMVWSILLYAMSQHRFWLPLQPLNWKWKVHKLAMKRI